MSTGSPPVQATGTAPVALLATLLCIASGSIDAISFLALGEAFSSVMTGNIVFLGISAAQRTGELAIFCGTALVGYAVGGALTSWVVARLARPGEAPIWPVRVTIMLAVETVLLAGVGIAWLLCGGEPDHAGKLALLAAGALSMGVQGAAVRAIGVAVSTTYMTGALTTLLEALVTRRGFTHTERSAVGGLVALCSGALLGAGLLETARPAALFLPCVGVLLVVVISGVVHRRRMGS